MNGNDVTLSVDGFGILYATVSEGIGNGSVGLASYNAVTKFDNLEVGAEVFAGKAVPFPYMENFNDGIANHFYFSHPDKWETITRSNEHVLRGNTSPIQANFATLGYVPISGLPQTYDISVKMKSLESNTGWHDGFLIFDYISPTSFKFAGMFAGQNQWVIGQYEGNWGNRLAQVDWDDTGRDILTNQYYDVRVRIDGNKATLFVDGELITSATFQIGIRKGPVGVAIDRAFTWFDDFKVSPPLTLDTLFEDFDDELVQELTTPDPTLWDFVELDESGTDIGFAADSTTPDELALQLTDPLYVLPPSFTLDVAVQFSPSAGNWQDGFLIFDYKNENDFKYAGAFAGQNEWAIGHYQGNWGDKLVVVDWDNEGKSIDVDTFYDLHLSVTGDEVRLSVDGVEIVTHTFAGPVNKGRAGFGAYNALTVFNDFLFDEILVP